MSDTDEELSNDETEQNEMRSKISKLSLEDLQKLKARLGSKAYKEVMYGIKNVNEKEFKRLNKNRPVEVSSKIKPDFLKKKSKKNERIVDPRFDSLCGTFNQKHFDNTYEFLGEIRQKEKAKLKNLLKREKNPDKASKIQYLIQRMENQDREKMRRKKEKESKEMERNEQIKALESGKKPYFRTKYEKKIVQLVEKYSDLKKRGKVEKYIEKKQKKQKAKEKPKRYFEVNIPDS